MKLIIAKFNKAEISLSLSTKESASFVCHYLPYIDFSHKPIISRNTQLGDSHISYTYALPDHKLLSLSGKSFEVLPVVNFIYSYHQTFLDYSL